MCALNIWKIKKWHQNWSSMLLKALGADIMFKNTSPNLKQHLLATFEQFLKQKQSANTMVKWHIPFQGCQNKSGKAFRTFRDVSFSPLTCTKFLIKKYPYEFFLSEQLATTLVDFLFFELKLHFLHVKSDNKSLTWIEFMNANHKKKGWFNRNSILMDPTQCWVLNCNFPAGFCYFLGSTLFSITSKLSGTQFRLFQSFYAMKEICSHKEVCHQHHEFARGHPSKYHHGAILLNLNVQLERGVSYMALATDISQLVGLG